MRWTLVTGSAKGLGRSIALSLAKEGHSLVLHYNKSDRDAIALSQMCRDLGATAEIIQGDFSSQASLTRFIEEYLHRFPKSAHLVNNVGNYFIGSVENTPSSEWQSLFQTNLFAPLQLIQALIPSLMEGGGTVTNIGVAGIPAISLKNPAYTATKLALWQLTKTLAKELIEKGVRVNMVSPGYMENAVDLPADLSVLPMKRAAYLDEVARVVMFLMSPKSGYITGQNMEVAGGVRL